MIYAVGGGAGWQKRRKRLPGLFALRSSQGLAHRGDIGRLWHRSTMCVYDAHMTEIKKPEISGF